MSAGHDYVGGKRGSGIVSSAAYMLVMTGVGGVCEMCIAQGGDGGEWIRGLGLSLTNPVERGRALDMCLCCGGVCGEWVRDWVMVWKGGVVLCRCELDTLTMTGPGICIM